MKEVRVQSQNPRVSPLHCVIPDKRSASRNPARIRANDSLCSQRPSGFPPGLPSARVTIFRGSDEPTTPQPFSVNLEAYFK